MYMTGLKASTGRAASPTAFPAMHTASRLHALEAPVEKGSRAVFPDKLVKIYPPSCQSLLRDTGASAPPYQRTSQEPLLDRFGCATCH